MHSSPVLVLALDERPSLLPLTADAPAAVRDVSLRILAER